MVRKKTVALFEEWRAEPANLDEFFRLIEGAESVDPIRFRDACVSVKQPYTLMYALVHGDPLLKARYDAVLAATADRLAHEALAISDEQAEVAKENGETFDPDVQRDRLRVETRLKLAAKWDRERYGDRVERDVTVSVTADAGLVGLAGELLKKVRGRVLEHEAARLPKEADGQAS